MSQTEIEVLLNTLKTQVSCGLLNGFEIELTYTGTKGEAPKVSVRLFPCLTINVHGISKRE